MFSSSLFLETEEAAVDNCPERMDAADAKAPRIESGMALEAVLAL